MKKRVPQKTIRPFGTQYAVMVLLCGVWIAAACYVFIAIFSPVSIQIGLRGLWCCS